MLIAMTLVKTYRNISRKFLRNHKTSNNMHTKVVLVKHHQRTPPSQMGNLLSHLLFHISPLIRPSLLALINLISLTKKLLLFLLGNNE